jgi:hypothetical protein
MVQHGQIHFGDPGNSLPKHVRLEAETRGYADALEPLSLLVTPSDIDLAFQEVAQGNGAACVMAQAGRRLGARWVYFYRTTAWVDLGEGPFFRFETSSEIYSKVIKPFDDFDREAVLPGLYHLIGVRPSSRIEAKRVAVKANRDRVEAGGEVRSDRDVKRSNSYLGRVVMGALA